MRTFKLLEIYRNVFVIELYENGTLQFSARVTDAAMGAVLGGAWMNSSTPQTRV